MILSNHLILCFPLLLPSIFPSIKVFSNELALHIRWPKYWSFSFSISPSNEYSVLISFRIDWFDVLAVQGTLKNLFQHHSLKASIFQCSAFFMVQLLHTCIITGKTMCTLVVQSRLFATPWTVACQILCPWDERPYKYHQMIVKWTKLLHFYLFSPFAYSKIACLLNSQSCLLTKRCWEMTISSPMQVDSIV